MSTVFLIHGIRAKDKGVASMTPLLDELSHRGIKGILVTYGYVLIPITNKRAISKTISAIEKHQNPDDVVVIAGYSNGGYTAVQVAEMGYKVDHLFLISPALHSHHEIPRHVKTIDVFYSEEDLILTFAKWYRWVNRILPWRWFNRHDWGEAGRIGLQQKDDRIINHDMGDTGHSFYKHPDVINFIVNKMEERMSNYQEDRDA